MKHGVETTHSYTHCAYWYALSASFTEREHNIVIFQNNSVRIAVVLWMLSGLLCTSEALWLGHHGNCFT